MFQSTHPHGVRHSLLTKFAIMVSFNPRTHTGCDFSSSEVARKLTDVSIHAPTRGATRQSTRTKPNKKFQSTHPHGVRQRYIDGIRQMLMFQSTHPHGVRQARSRRVWLRVWFQSTHPHGVRRRGVTFRYVLLFCFNPRTHTGCDAKYLQNNFIQSMFQSTHPHGVRHSLLTKFAIMVSFNPRTHTGCDLIA